jgi:hypothetical protein
MSSKEVSKVPTPGRNEPCPCGSKKKFKRCCGMNASPVMQSTAPPPAQVPAGGFDPNQINPQMMMKLSQALQRLPRGQMQRLQALMQKAMAGKDITREAQELEKTLPSEFQELMQSANLAGMLGGAAGLPAATPEQTPMNIEEAKDIVAEAVASGKISHEQAAELLSSTATAPDSKIDAHEQGKGSFWKKITGKNS